MAAVTGSRAGAPVVEITGVSYRFAGASDPVFRDLGFAVRPGEFVAVVGGSGVGKSTMLRVLMGLITPDAGAVTINVPRRPGSRRRAMVFQDSRLLPWRRIADNVAYGLAGLKLAQAEIDQRVADALELTGLTALAARWPHQLSGGQMQRVGIARALAVHPDILLMDEPFSAVDAITRRGLQDELLRIWSTAGKAVVFVTHDIDEAVYLSDRVIVMAGQPATIASDEINDLGRPRQRSSAALLDRSGRIGRRLEMVP